MKKALGWLVAVMLILACVPAFSQSREEVKDAYVKSVPIVKIYTHYLGYRVVYLKSNYEVGEFYVPLSWFYAAVPKAQIVWGNGRAFPYFSLFWVDGKFDYVRLYLVDNPSDLTWGVMDTREDLSAKFNVEGPPKEY